MIQVNDIQELRLLTLVLAAIREQTELLRSIAADTHSIWAQLDDTPVGFKINERKL